MGPYRHARERSAWVSCSHRVPRRPDHWAFTVHRAGHPGGDGGGLGGHQQGPPLRDHRRLGGQLQPVRALRQLGAQLPPPAPGPPLLARRRHARAALGGPDDPTGGRVARAPLRPTRVVALRHRGGGFVLGLSLGLVFVPCAGPVLAAISVAAGPPPGGRSTSLLVTLFYALGVTVPLLVFAVVAQARHHLVVDATQPPPHHPAGGRGRPGGHDAGHRLQLARRPPTRRPRLHDCARRSHRVDQLGVHPAATASAATPERFAAANARLEGKKATCAATDTGDSQSGHLAAGTTTTTAPQARPRDLPAEAGGVHGEQDEPAQPRTRPELHRHHGVVQHPGRSAADAGAARAARWCWSTSGPTRASTASASLPHVESWYNDYKKDGLVVVGRVTPRSSPSSTWCPTCRARRARSGVDYPVAIDNNLATWDAYNNQYWPADYLIDPTGVVRAYNFGEGGYGTMEATSGCCSPPTGSTHLPAPTDVADKTPTNHASPRRPTSATPSRTRSIVARRSTTTRPSTTALPRPSRRTPRLQRDVDRPFATRRRRRAPTPRSSCSSPPTTSTS